MAAPWRCGSLSGFLLVAVDRLHVHHWQDVFPKDEVRDRPFGEDHELIRFLDRGGVQLGDKVIEVGRVLLVNLRQEDGIRQFGFGQFGRGERFFLIQLLF